MNCKLCGVEIECKLCKGCREFLEWRYPNEDPERIVERYKKQSEKGSQK